LILVDSSIWIDFFRSESSPASTELRRIIADAEPFALTGIIATEILRGLTREVGTIEEYLGLWTFLEPTGLSTFREAARICRVGRSRGISLTTIDTLIAAIALENGARVFTLDSDFSQIARITRLQLHQLKSS
jgi:hypothetical protein